MKVSGERRLKQINQLGSPCGISGEELLGVNFVVVMDLEERRQLIEIFRR